MHRRSKYFGIVLIALLAFAAVMLFGKAEAKSAQEYFSEAQSLVQKRDYRSARVQLMNAVKADPKMTDALVAQAIVALELFDAQAAQSALEKALSNGVLRSDVAHLLGHSYWLQGERDKASEILSSDEIPAKNIAYANRISGRVELDRGDLVAAQAAFSAAVEAAPDDSQIWTDMARLRFVMADQKGAIDAVDYALKLDATNIRAMEFRGRLMRSQFGVVAALPWFERALQINATDVPLLEEYALTLGEAGRYRDMLTQARKILTLDSNNARAFYMQAVLAARAGNYELAKRILPKAGENFRDVPAALLLDGIIEYELGNYNQAVDRLQRLLGAQPRNRRVRALLAQAMYRSGDPLDALDTIREIAARGDADSYSLMTTARLFEATNERELAFPPLNDAALAVVRQSRPLPDPMTISQAADAVARSPNDARLVVPYIRLLLLENRIDIAASEAARLQSNNPGVADAHILMGDVEMARGNAGPAVAAFNKAREIRFTEPVMLRLVEAQSLAGDTKAADATLSAFLTYNPTNLNALRLAGYRNLDVGQWQNAIVLLERVRSRLGYNDSILLANLARAYSGAGKHEAAIQNAAIAYQIAPANSMVTQIYGETLLRSGIRPKASAELLQKAVNMMPDNLAAAANLRRAKAALAKSAQRQ